MAIEHNPQMAQYYVHRARSRQLIHNIFGARQDVATALILDPKQPKLLPLVASLFPGMAEEEVLRSQVGLLAQLQLSRVVESRLQKSTPQGILGQLQKLELDRQRARTLPRLWNKEQILWGTSQKLGAAPPAQGEPAPPGEAEAAAAKEEELPEMSSSPSYPDWTLSSSVCDLRDRSVSGTETSTTGQYRSSSATPVLLTSDSSLLRTQSSELESDKKDGSPSESSINNKDFWAQTPLVSETGATQSQKPSKAEATQGPRPRLRKTKATQGPRPRLRKTKAVHRRRAVEAEATRGLLRSSSKTKTDDEPSPSPSNTEATQGEGQWFDMAKALQKWDESPESSQTDIMRVLSQNPSKIHSQSPTPDSAVFL